MSAAKRRLLLVEGRDDEQVVYPFCNLHGLDNRALFTVSERDGYDNVRDALVVEPRRPEVDAIGAIVDADVAPKARWQSLRDAIARCGGYAELPVEPPAEGLIHPGGRGRPTLGLWMMPDNRGRGMIEDFLRGLGRADDRLFGRAEEAVDGIPEGDRLFKPGHRSKAILHTWLAWQAEPGLPMGRALTLKCLDPEHAHGRAFLAWLVGLFGPSA